MSKYLFKKPLIEGLIKSKPNRFIMQVMVNNKLETCHCPSTGRIGSLKFEDIPCLLSQSDSSLRKTKFTVEAISLDSPESKNKSWIGINQTKANAYIEFFLKSGLLSNLIPKIEILNREVCFANSRFDFSINENTFLEVKTPLKDIDCSKHPNYKEFKGKFLSFDRIIKHFTEISKTGGRTIFLLCYLYDAPEFKVPEKSEPSIIKAANDSYKKGLENWQINLKFDKNGISLIKYFKLNLF